MSTGQTLRVCGGALLDLYVLQLLPAGTHCSESSLASGEDVLETSPYAHHGWNRQECTDTCLPLDPPAMIYIFALATHRQLLTHLTMK